MTGVQLLVRKSVTCKAVPYLTVRNCIIILRYQRYSNALRVLSLELWMKVTDVMVKEGFKQLLKALDPTRRSQVEKCFQFQF